METSVVVVHGIGDPLPGNALEKLVQGLSAAHWQQVEGSWVETRHEKGQLGPDDREVKTFPVARATLERTENSQVHRLHLREVYWGDISRQKASLFGLISAVFDLIFGLRYIVAAATSQTTGLAYLSGWIAGGALYLIRAPMFALNILAIVIAGLYVWFGSFTWKIDFLPFSLAAAIVGSIIVFLLGCAVFCYARRLEWSPHTAYCMMVLSPIILLLCKFVKWSGEGGMYELIGVENSVGLDITTIMTVVAAGVAVFAVAYLLVGSLAWLCSKQSRRAITVITFCTGLSLALFTFVVIAMWIVFSKGIRETTSEKIDRCIEHHWQYSDYCILFDLSAPVGSQLAERIEVGIHLLPLLVICFGGMGVLFLLVAGCNFLMSLNNNFSEKKRFRYIVNPAIAAVFFVASGFFAFMFVWHCALLFFPSLPLREQFIQMREYLGENALKSLAVGVTASVVSIIVASRSHFLFALDLVLDVIMHFRVSYYDGGRSNVSWRRTVNRFRQVLECELAKDAGARKVVVVAHSLGSAISADGLGALKVVGVSEGSDVNPTYSRVSFVTMGNPIINLLKFYLPDRYQLHPGAVLKWFNIYRIDDFVGTKLGVDQVHERNVGLGGHTDYWSDPRVVPGLIEAIHHAQNRSETIQSELDIKAT